MRLVISASYDQEETRGEGRVTEGRTSKVKGTIMCRL